MRKLLFVLMAALVLISCGKDGNEPEVVYTVTFNADGGTPAPQSQTVKAGEKATAPTSPTKQGYVFLFWHLSGSTTAYNFATPVTSDITLQAKWESEAVAEYWQVSWNLDGGTWPATGDNHATQVVKGGTLAEPTPPTKAGKTFDGWYKETALTNKINFPYSVSAVTENITMYAKWNDPAAEYWSITWELNGGAWPSTGDNHVDKVEKGSTLSEPVAPTKTGSSFDGWYKDAAFTNKVTFPATVTTDFKLYAKWNTGTLNVYTAGYVRNEKGNRVATVWKNKEVLYKLTNGEYDALTYSIYVSGNDVYVVGKEDNAIGASEGRVWKNGQKLYSFTNGSQDVSAYSVCLSGSNVYVSGEMRPRGTTNFTGKVWKNGTELHSFNGSVSDMSIYNNDIYVCGSQGSNAKVWKNGIEYWTSDVFGYSAKAYRVYTSGGNIYTAMNWTSSTSVIIAKINQGNTFTQLYSLGNLPNPSSSATATSFVQSGSDDIYTSVNTRQPVGISFITQGRIYKNGSLLYELGGEAIMCLFGNDIYWARTYQNKITIYKNEPALYTLHEGSYLDNVSDIFVIEN